MESEQDDLENLNIPDIPERHSEKKSEKGITINLYYIEENDWKLVLTGVFRLIIDRKNYIIYFCIQTGEKKKKIWKLIIQRPFSMSLEKGFYIVFRGIADIFDPILFEGIETKKYMIWGVSISKIHNANRIFIGMENCLRNEYPKLQSLQKKRRKLIKRESMIEPNKEEEEGGGIMSSVWNYGMSFFKSPKKNKRMTISGPTEVKRRFHVSSNLLSSEWKDFLFNDCGINESQFNDQKVVKRVIGILKQFEKARNLRMSVKADMRSDLRIYESKLKEMEQQLKNEERKSQKKALENDELQRKIHDLETKKIGISRSLEKIDKQPLPIDKVALPSSPIPKAPPIPKDFFDPNDPKKKMLRMSTRKKRMTKMMKVRPNDFTQSEKVSMMSLIKQSMGKRRFQMEGRDSNEIEKVLENEEETWSSGDESRE